MRSAPNVFLTLSADGSAREEDQRSTSRKALTILGAAVLMVSAPLFLAGPATSGDGGNATLVKPIALAADDDDDDGAAGGDDDDSAGTASDPGTGNDTMGNTDAGGQDTGQSTVGETEGQDGTGQTERTEGTGVETQGQTDDNGGQGTGVSTAGETDGPDDTGQTERV
jgi:hypothetical protein